MEGLRTFRVGGLFDGRTTRSACTLATDRDGTVVDIIARSDREPDVDLSACYVVPGLVDAHVHLCSDKNDSAAAPGSSPLSLRFYRSVGHLQATLNCGVTRVRDASGADLGTKQAVHSGMVAGPPMKISITMIGPTGGHTDPDRPDGMYMTFQPVYPGRPDSKADGVEEIRRRIRSIAACGADVIKVAVSGSFGAARGQPRYPNYSGEELHALVSEARRWGLPTMAHAHGAAAVEAAVDAGVVSVEHGIETPPPVADRMAERGVALVPTLAATANKWLSVGDSGLLDRHRASVAAARAAGVRIAMGSDAGMTPHGRNILEVSELQSAGLTALDAWRAATVEGGRLLGFPESGVLAAGHPADFAVFPGEGLPQGSRLERGSIATFVRGRRVDTHATSLPGVSRDRPPEDEDGEA